MSGSSDGWIAYKAALQTDPAATTLAESSAVLTVLIAAARYDVARNAGGGSDLDCAELTLSELLKIADGIENARAVAS